MESKEEGEGIAVCGRRLDEQMSRKLTRSNCDRVERKMSRRSSPFAQLGCDSSHETP